MPSDLKEKKVAEFDEKFPPTSSGKGDYTESPIPSIKSFLSEVIDEAYEAGEEAVDKKWGDSFPKDWATASQEGYERGQRDMQEKWTERINMQMANRYPEMTEDWNGGYSSGLRAAINVMDEHYGQAAQAIKTTEAGIE